MMKKQLEQLLNAKVSVRKGTGTLKGYLLIQSDEVNLWINESKIKTLFPTFWASGSSMGLIPTWK